MLKNNPVYLTLPIILQSFDGFSLFEIESEGGYKVISEIIMMCLTESALKFDVQVPIELLELSKKYFCILGEAPTMILEQPADLKKKLLIEEIRFHKLWKD